MIQCLEYYLYSLVVLPAKFDFDVDLLLTVASTTFATFDDISKLSPLLTVLNGTTSPTLKPDAEVIVVESADTTLSSFGASLYPIVLPLLFL